MTKTAKNSQPKLKLEKKASSGKKGGKIAKEAAQKLTAMGEELTPGIPNAENQEITDGSITVSTDQSPETSTPQSIRKPKSRSSKYKKAKALVDRTKLYPLSEAIALALKTHIAKFEGKVEAHLVVGKVGSLGLVEFPHLTKVEKKVVVFDDSVLAELQQGTINFDVLLASPANMPKLVPFARLLGPKGLMPNPKNGTLTADPQKATAKFKTQGTEIKTEKKAPLIHITIGTTSQKAPEIEANARALLKTVGPLNILKFSLSSTMGPGVKVHIDT